MPSMRMKTNTASRFAARLSIEVTTTASGITMRGKCILRTRLSRLTTARTAPFVASEKNV